MRRRLPKGRGQPGLRTNAIYAAWAFLLRKVLVRRCTAPQGAEVRGTAGLVRGWSCALGRFLRLAMTLGLEDGKRKISPRWHSSWLASRVTELSISRRRHRRKLRVRRWGSKSTLSSEYQPVKQHQSMQSTHPAQTTETMHSWALRQAETDGHQAAVLPSAQQGHGTGRHLDRDCQWSCCANAARQTRPSWMQAEARQQTPRCGDRQDGV
jgi:hypothetical protein